MALSFVRAAGVQDGTGTVHTLAVDCTGGNFLSVFVMIAGANTISAATYNGSALTFAVKSNTAGQDVHAYHILNPTTGTNNISITTGASGFCYITAVVLGGADSTTPVGNVGSADGTAGSITLATLVSGAWIICGVRDAIDGITTAGASTVSDFSTAVQAYHVIGTTPGSYTANITGLTTGANGAIAAIVVNPSLSTGGTSKLLTFVGS